MKRFLKRVAKGIRDPKRAIQYFFKKKFKWRDSSTDGVKKKKYKTYDEYLKHQKMKLNKMPPERLAAYDKSFYQALRYRINGNTIPKGSSVLCLGARIGTEVRAFIDENMFAIGVDLNPGQQNKYVVVGDFHKLQFSNETVDAVYTNSLDHCYNYKQVMSEANRVLKKGGRFIVELVVGQKQGHNFGYYESIVWENNNTMIEEIKKFGFEIEKIYSFLYPWKGTHIVFKK